MPWIEGARRANSPRQTDRGVIIKRLQAESDEVSRTSDLGRCREQLELHSALLDSVGDGIIAHTAGGHVVYANTRAAQMLGYTLDEFLAIAPWGWSQPDTLKRVPERMKELRDSDGRVFETHCRSRDGRDVLVEVHSRVVDMEPWGELVVAVCRDLSVRSAQQERMRRLAFYDSLTGLCNRTLLETRMSAALHEAHGGGQTVGVIFMDLDDFKPVNDTHGHAMGDRVLRIIAERMLKCVRDTDTIARVGGDEFVALFPGLDNRPDLAARAKAIAECVSHPIAVDGLTVAVSVSVGLATYRQGEHYDELISRADHAMYRAKLRGRDGWEEFLESA